MSVVLFSNKTEVINEVKTSFVTIFEPKVIREFNLEYLIKNKNLIDVLIIDYTSLKLNKYDISGFNISFNFPIIIISSRVEYKFFEYFDGLNVDFISFPFHKIDLNRVKNYYMLNKLGYTQITDIEKLKIENENILNKQKKQLDNIVKANFSSENFFKSIFELDKRKYKVWTIFELKFNEIFPEFYNDVNKKNNNLTQNELRLLSCIKVNLSYNEISDFSGISIKAIHQALYRLKKKLNLKSKNGLQEFVREI